jgi:mannose-6-phosphate isomerase class I
MVYFDITPKQAILRAKNGKMKNLGDKEPRSFKEILRRAYYVDFELASELRGELLKQGLIDYYIASDSAEGMRMIPAKAFNTIMEALSGMPFRCKPVYIEGVWGGQFIKKIRRLPDTVKNVAWSFDMIPLEVSILVKAGENLLEFPYYTFFQKEGISIMGEACVKKFKGYFPIRFNYDDTFHGSGNMSIQVHPTEKYCRENFNEHGRQDESYYVVATGHGAKTYIGFKEGADADEFIKEAKKSERDNTKIDYEAYINSVASFPGRQCLLPAGTIHSSGRNQVVLEIGSLTIGSYTYKLYDYLRADLDGKPRPIRTYHGERVLNKERKADWVKENLVKEPILARKDEGYAEYVVGEHDLIYFSL